jgi:hypothetical protein
VKLDGKSSLNLWMALAILTALAYVSPIGEEAKTYAASFFSTPDLYSTIAEHQMISHWEYVQALGFLGYSAGGIKVLDVLMLMFLLLVAFDLTYRNSREALFAAVIVMPLYLLFSYQLKFITYLGVMSAVALTVALGRLWALVRDMGGMEDAPNKEAVKYAGYVIAGFAGLVLLHQGFTIAGDVGPFVMALDGGNVRETCVELGQTNVISQKLFCNKIPDHWVEALGWIRENSGQDDAVLAWWDYGHWINYVGDRKAVLRNDLAYPGMIRDFSSALTGQDGGEMLGFMGYEKGGMIRARYLILNEELLGKWAAVAYMSCLDGGNAGQFQPVAENRSGCERELEFEGFADPGMLSLSDYCPGQTHFKASTNRGGSYCIPVHANATAEILDARMGNPVNVTFYTMVSASEGYSQTVYLMFYQQGEAERRGGPYGSVFYRGWVLGEIDGMRKVYSDGDGLGRLAIYELEQT